MTSASAGPITLVSRMPIGRCCVVAVSLMRGGSKREKGNKCDAQERVAFLPGVSRIPSACCDSNVVSLLKTKILSRSDLSKSSKQFVLLLGEERWIFFRKINLVHKIVS